MLEFDGDPTHAFVEVYRILKEIHRDRRISGICVDLSHGWNFLSVLAYLGAAAFRDAYLPDLRLEVKSSEPYTALASPSVHGKGSDRGGNRRRLPSGEGEGKYALGLIDVEPAADTLRLVRDAAAVRAIPHRSLSFEAMLSAYEAATGELGLLPEAARCLVKSAALLRKISCGLHLGIIPYLHWSLTLLGDSLPYLRRVVDEVEGLFGGSVYLEADLAEGRVSYRKKPPLTYVLLDVLVRLLEELWNELSAYLKDPDGISKYSIIPGFVEALRRYYLKRGMGATLALIDVELGFSAAADQSLDVSRLVDLLNFLLDLDPARRRLVSGVAVGYLLGWIEDLRGARLKSVPAQVSLTGSLTRDLSEIPLYGLYLVKKKKLSLDLMSQKVEDWLRANVNGLSEVSPHRLLASARAIEARFEGLAAELRAGCGDERWLKNLSIALDLTLGAEPTPEQIDDLVRNMMAHVGLQHFTIASIFADFDSSWRLVDVRMVYMGGLFEAMDRVAAEQALSGSQATDLADRLRREFPEDLHLLGCLCDLTPSAQTR